ncbi:MAG: FHIPEP family type III secretion protein, partial [Planctomycetes bacterium]|nr:FHIPEP family type III secretion protein [Planctomycetota bacterium]
AMPGKQMSIDADLRGGLINEAQARERRHLLERESKLYGAMDGAMKFVKGDAIAGIVISAVNIVGGLVIGVLQLKMSAGEAVETFSLLTIGDGLVSQIPALLLSVSAGIVVTRVAAGPGTDGKETHLAQDMVAQFLVDPKVLAICGFLLLVLGATSGTTGFPTVPFTLLGAAAVLTAILRHRRQVVIKADAAAKADAASEEAESSKAKRGRFAPGGLVLEVHEVISEIFGARSMDGGKWKLNQDVAKLLENVAISESAAIGIPVPRINCKLGVSGMELGTYNLIGNGVLFARGEEIQPERIFVACAPHETDRLLAAGVPASAIRKDSRTGEFAIHYLPGTHVRGVYVFAEESAKLGAFFTLSTVQVVCQHLRHAIRQNAADLLRSAELATLLDAIGDDYLPLLGEKGVVTRLRLLEILRELLGSLVPVRNLPEILSALNRLYQAYGAERFRQFAPAELMAHLRLALRRVLMESCCGAKRRIRFYRFDEDLDELVAQFPRLRYEDESLIREVVREGVDANEFLDIEDLKRMPYPVILTQNPAKLREIIKGEFPEIITFTRLELDTAYFDLNYSDLGVLRAARTPVAAS